MATHSISVAIPAGLTGGAVTGTLEGAVGLGLVVALVALVVPHMPQILDSILTHWVQSKEVDVLSKAVDRARVGDLPALVQAFPRRGAEPPDSEEGASP